MCAVGVVLFCVGGGVFFIFIFLGGLGGGGLITSCRLRDVGTCNTLLMLRFAELATRFGTWHIFWQSI